MTLPAELSAEIEAYAKYLEELSPGDRFELAGGVRRCRVWPSEAFVRWHSRKHGEGRDGPQYVEWAQVVKGRAGVEIWAYVHPVEQTRSLVFVEHREGAVVQFDLDAFMNMDCYTMTMSTRLWLAEKSALGTHWRVRDMEL